MKANKRLTFDESFDLYVKSGAPIIAITTTEVDRCTENLQALTKKLSAELKDRNLPDSHAYLRDHGYAFMIWDMARGWHSPKGEVVAKTDKPEAALEYLTRKDERGSETPPGIYVMQNFHLHLQDPYTLPVFIQRLRDVYSICKAKGVHLFIVGCQNEFPTEIRPQIASMDFSLPTRDELVEIIKDFLTKYGREVKDKKGKTEDTVILMSEVEAAADAATGMTTYELEAAIAVALKMSKGQHLDRNLIFEEKAQIVKRSGLLEHIPTDLTLDSDVGGLENLKTWLRLVAKAFNNRKAAEEYNLPIPKGFLAAGLSGTGKTLTAKAVASLFGVPLFRCDIGRVFGGIVGETETKTRELFDLMTALSPAVFLIDEMEKSLSGAASSGATDGGVTSRLLGGFLYFMQEKTVPAYIVGTVNSVDALPPELLRRGRFDEFWMLDLPSKIEREQILDIHIKNKGRDNEKFWKGKENKELKEKILTQTDQFVGAEIEDIIKQAMFFAFAQDREFTPADILMAAEKTIPLTKTKPEEMQALRKWAVGKARPASGSDRDKKGKGSGPDAFLPGVFMASDGEFIKGGTA